MSISVSGESIVLEQGFNVAKYEELFFDTLSKGELIEWSDKLPWHSRMPKKRGTLMDSSEDDSSSVESDTSISSLFQIVIQSQKQFTRQMTAQEEHISLPADAVPDEFAPDATDAIVPDEFAPDMDHPILEQVTKTNNEKMDRMLINARRDAVAVDENHSASNKENKKKLAFPSLQEHNKNFQAEMKMQAEKKRQAEMKMQVEMKRA
eukprot:scaffold37644_cov153-Skeletonema_marinoi.AAC.1